jgi:hypothetical protein
VSNSGAVHVEEEASEGVASELPERESVPRPGSSEKWILDHFDAVASAVVASGFVIRFLAAARSYLNPDEALHYLILNQSSAYLAYKASLTNAHPPLIYLLVYYLHFLGRSELMLRLPSVVAGTAFCWLLYKWMGLAFGRAASWIGLILATYLPSMVALSAELRAYALLLFCMAGALYFLERSFAEKSVHAMWGFSAFLYLAILSHYSAVFFAAAAGVYVLARIADGQLPRKIIMAWGAGEAGALAILVFLYVTHVSKLKNSIAVWSMGFDTAYFHRDSTGIFAFTERATFDVFLFLFAQRYVAQAMLLCFVAAVAILLVRGLLSSREGLGSNRLGLLLLLPFFAVWGAAIAGIYPYIGSRHTVFLAPFEIAAASYLLAMILRQRLWAGILLAALLAIGSNTARASAPIQEMAEQGTPGEMASAISYVQQTIPRGDIILVDFQSSLPLAYYLCGPKAIFPIDMFHQDYFEFNCEGYSVVTLHVWRLIAHSFRMQFEKTARARDWKSGDRVWIYQTGWGPDLAKELAEQDAEFRCLAPGKVTGGVTITPFLVGPNFSAAPLHGPC